MKQYSSKKNIPIDKFLHITSGIVQIPEDHPWTPRIRAPVITKFEMHLDTEYVPQTYQGDCSILYFPPCLAHCWVIACVQEYRKKFQLQQYLCLIKRYLQVISSKFYFIF